MFALILENKVVDVSESRFPVSKDLEWVECDSRVTPGWHYIDNQFKETLETFEEIFSRLKAQKIAEIKATRDTKNIEPIVDVSAEILNENGASSGINTFFLFHANRHPSNPACDPSSILTNAIVLGQTIPYSTRDISGTEVTIALTPAVAKAIAGRISQRNNNNYKSSDILETRIAKATSEIELAAINWNTKV